ncbi:unnamed protein product, partial [Ixodes persulcatus]
EKGALVYPRILASRGLNEEIILKINEDITLNLERTSVFPERLLIRTHEEGSLVNNYVDWSEHNQYLYHDTEKMAAVIMKDNNGVNVEGLLRHDLRIQPMPELERSLEGHVAHMLFSVKQRMPFHGDHGIINYISLFICKKISITNYIKIKIKVIYLTNESTQFKSKTSQAEICLVAFLAEERITEKITPEVHVVLDANTSSAYSYNKQAITDYLSVLAAAVSNYYSLFKQKRSKQSLFLKIANCILRRYYVPKVWYAYLSRVCTVFKVGMSEDEPKSYDGVHLFSHEIAHLLGCAHDEDPPDGTMKGHPGSKNCPWNDGYIMSYVINFEHHYTFSPCCVKSIRFVAK